MKKTNKNLTSFADHLDSEYGKRGTEIREKYEEGFEAIKLGVMLQELRK
jgi:HTH-type transcriptional regulator / antitoxin HipB